jgi:predicted RNase H-like nuclease (RuvC/YqgF family)
MTNAELKKEVTTLKEENGQLRSRLSTLRDEIIDVKADLSRTKQMLQRDIRTLVDTVGKRRVL